jgi:hypothetical protein
VWFNRFTSYKGCYSNDRPPLFLLARLNRLEALNFSVDEYRAYLQLLTRLSQLQRVGLFWKQPQKKTSTHLLPSLDVLPTLNALALGNVNLLSQDVTEKFSLLYSRLATLVLCRVRNFPSTVLQQMTTLRSLSLDTVKGDDKQELAVAALRCTTLTELTLCSLYAPELPVDSDLPQLTSLTLDMVFYDTMQFYGSMSALTDLNITNDEHFNDTALRALCKSLTRLRLTCCQGRLFQTQTLAQSCQKLQLLQLNDSNHVALDNLCALPALTTLQLAQMYYVLVLQPPTTLRELKVEMYDLTTAEQQSLLVVLPLGCSVEWPDLEPATMEAHRDRLSFTFETAREREKIIAKFRKLAAEYQ